MALATIQNSFSAGEFSPQMYGRSDLQKFHIAASTLRNFFVNYRGGASSRAGLAYVGMCKQGAPNAGGTPTANVPRDIPFQFNINQGYVLEFGDQYMRIKFQGSYVTESAVTITGATNANPCVFHIPAHGYSVGDWIFISSVVGMTSFNGLTWVVTSVPDADHVIFSDLFGTIINSTAYPAYISGGTASRIYTQAAPYAAIDLPFLKFTQSANTMTLTCVNQETGTEYLPYDLVRNGNTAWVFTANTFSTSISAPTNVSVVANSSTTKNTWYAYVVTAVSATTGEESIASLSGTVENNNIAINAGSNVISWTAVAGASYYNIYKSTPAYSVGVPAGASFGFCGSAFGTSFTDSNITADFTRTPPIHSNPFARQPITAVTVTAAGTGYSQDTVTYQINTSTGIGFSGTPVISGGALTAFIITNAGSGYAVSDTITINDGSVKATGTYTFNHSQPTNGQTIILNGSTWTFVTAITGANQVQISTGNFAGTGNNLIAALNASTDPLIAVATYSISSSVMTITYDAPGTIGNSYTLAAGTYGGSVSGSTLTGGINGTNNSATASLTIGPATGTYPGVVAYFQQRRGYAYTTNQPNNYFFSQPGAFQNMDSAIPTIDTDAIIGAPWAQQVNGIQYMVPMTSGLVILTGSGAWLLNGGGTAALTPADQTAAAQAYNGCHFHVPPLVINYDLLYVQAKGSIVRDLAYNFFVNIYTGTDLTVLSNHLFNYHQMQAWAYAEEPYKLVWVIRDDGVMLCLTYLKEQDVYAWSRHDTNGFFVGVCTVTEPPIDAVYVIVQRKVRGQWVYYSERMDNRNWIEAEDSFCVDAGLQYPQTYPAATIYPAALTGTSNITSVAVANGGTGYVAPVAVAVDPTGKGTGAILSVTVTLGVITAISVLTQGQNYQPGTVIRITDSAGTGASASPVIQNIVQFTASAAVFTAGSVGQVIRIGNNNAPVASNNAVTCNGGGKAQITSYVNSTTVMADILIPITAVVPNDPLDTPQPVISGQWSVSTPTTVVTGLNHLEGLQGSCLADGGVVDNLTPTLQTNGTVAVTLPQAASAIAFGLGYTCQLQTMYLDPPGHPVTAQGKRKDIPDVILRIESSRGITVGTNQPDAATLPNSQAPAWTDMTPFKEWNPAVQTPGQPEALITGDMYITVTAQWNRQGQVACQQSNPLPANILAVICQYSMGDTPSP